MVDGTSDPIFVRETRTIHIKPRELKCIRNLTDSNNVKYRITSGIVGFCGTIYPYIKIITHLEKYGYPYHTGLGEHNVDIIYDFEDLKKYPTIYNKDVKVDVTRWNYMEFKSLESIHNWLEDGITASTYNTSNSVINDKKFTDIFKNEKCAYFNYYPDYNNDEELIIYPQLRDVMFYKVYDIHQTFQRIEWYLTNELVNPDNPYIKPVPDHIKAQSKGFDKFSFRKEKQKQKGKKHDCKN